MGFARAQPSYERFGKGSNVAALEAILLSSALRLSVPTPRSDPIPIARSESIPRSGTSG